MISGADLFLGLFNNLAIFVVVAAAYGSMHAYFEKRSPFLRAVAMGFAFGTAALICMHVRIKVADGVIVDQRNALIALSGGFGGPIAALISAGAAAAYRAYLGGAGVLSGAVGCGLAGSAGVFLYFLRKKKPGAVTYGIGSFVATLIILPGFLLFKDFETGLHLMLDMSIPYGAAILTGILLMGLLLSREERRRAAEKKLVESEKRFRDLYEGLIDVSHQTDREGRIVHISPSAERLFGIPSASLVGRYITEAYRYPEKRELFLDLLKREGRVEGFESEIVKSDGSILWISTNARIVLDADGEFAGVEGISRDITKRKRAEEENLILEESLRQSQKMEALGTLAGGIAHDFNNILGAVIGFTEVVLNDLPSDSPNRHHLQVVLTSAERAADLTRQILTFSRKAKPVKKQIRIDLVVEETVRLLRKTIPSTVRIRETVDPNSGFVFADSTQIHQIIMNLCTNAYHALENETGEIRIGLGVEAVAKEPAVTDSSLKPGQYAVISVKDTGRGIPKEALPRIFEPFYTTKPMGKGTGLGLSVVHGIVKDHGGTIVVSSEPNIGTSFRIYLPSVEEPEAAVSPNLSVPPKGGSERILVVDDDPAITAVWQTILEGLGYRVIGVSSAEQALEMFRFAPTSFDLILTDQTMPHMTGEALAEQAMRIRPDIPMIICTGHSAALNGKSAKDIGVRAILLKPINSKQLANAIREALDTSLENSSVAAEQPHSKPSEF